MMSRSRTDTQVLIVGAGPTGLTLAIDLGLRGVNCTLIEQKPEPAFLPKMERCNARSMEIYRRMGIAERVRAAGLPAQCPMDIFIVFSLIEPPLVHHAHPSVAEAKARIAQCRDGNNKRPATAAESLVQRPAPGPGVSEPGRFFRLMQIAREYVFVDGAPARREIVHQECEPPGPRGL